MNNHDRLENSRLPPHITYTPLMIPYPGTPNGPFFNGQNITNVLDRYSQLCSDYDILGIGKDLSPPVVFWIFHWTLYQDSDQGSGLGFSQVNTTQGVQE